MLWMLTLLAGCDLFTDLQDDLEGYTNPMVVQGIVIGVAEPGDDIDLGDSDFSEGTVATVFVADAANAAQMGEAPVSGAIVNVLDADLEEGQAGTYKGKGMAYTPGAELVVEVDRGDSVGIATMTLPDAPVADIPEFHDGSALEVDLSTQDFDRMVVVVLDVSGGVTFSTIPSAIEDLYEFATDDSVSVTIPATAFQGSGFYAVGVAGLQNGDATGFDGMNTALSDVQAGQMKFWPLTTEAPQ